jgi:hypothetical protein
MSTANLDEKLADNRREYAQHGVTCLRGLFDRRRSRPSRPPVAT